MSLSQFTVMNPFDQIWLENAQCKDGDCLNRPPVKNKDLWAGTLIKIMDKLNPDWNWVRLTFAESQTYE